MRGWRSYAWVFDAQNHFMSYSHSGRHFNIANVTLVWVENPEIPEIQPMYDSGACNCWNSRRIINSLQRTNSD